MEFSLLGAVAVAIGAMYVTIRFEAGRTNAADCTRETWDALVTAMVAGLVVGRVVAMVRGGSNPLTHPGDLLIVRGGVDTVAAVLAGLVTFAVVERSDPWRMADVAAPAAVAGLAGWHAGCAVRDSCLGTPTDLPWALTEPGSTIGRHPVEIYAAILLAIVAIGLLLWKRAHPAPGAVASAGLAGAALSRLATEAMRPGLGGGLGWWYASAAGIASIAMVLRLRIRTRGGADPARRTL